MPDVELPDGTVIQGVPDGTTKADLIAKLQKNGHDVSWYKPDQQAAAPAAAPAPDQTSEPPVSRFHQQRQQAYGKAAGDLATTVSNIPGSAINMVTGLASAVMHPIDTAGTLLDTAAGAARAGAKAILPKGVTDFLDRIDNPQAVQRIAETASAVGGHLAEKYGSAEAIGNAIKTDPVGVAADLSMLVGGGGALAGRAGMARTADVMKTVGEYTNPVNALNPVARLAPQGVNAMRDIFNPKNNAYLTAAEGQGEDIINALNTTQAATPGTQLTAAEAASSVPNTLYPALQRAAQSETPTLYDNINRQNIAARQAAIDSFAGTPEQLQAAKNARSASANQAYTEAGKAPIVADPRLEGLLNSPAIDKVLGDIEFVGGNREAVGKTPFTLERGAPATEATPGRLVDTGATNPAGRPVRQFEAGTPATEATPSTGTVGDLHTLQVALKDMMNADPSVGGMKGLSSSSIGDVRKALIEWIEKNSDKYAAAREQFRKDSANINKMEVGQELSRRLADPLGAGEREGVFARAVENAPSTIKSATGTQLFQNLDQVIGPQNAAIVKGIQQDLAREALTESRAKMGSSSNIPDQSVPQIGVHGFAHKGLSPAVIFDGLMRKLGSSINANVLKQIAVEMASPENAAKAMQDALNYDKSRTTLTNNMLAFGRGANTTSRVTNALLQGQQMP